MAVRSRTMLAVIVAVVTLFSGITVASGSPTGVPGDLFVTTVNQDGAPLPGACYDLLPDDGSLPDVVASRCDPGDGADDGITMFHDVAPGQYVLFLYIAPDGYAVGEVYPITVVADERNRATITAGFGGATLTVLVRDATGATAPFRCVGLRPAYLPREIVDLVCDDNDGTIRMPGLAPGDYALFTTDDGPVAERAVTIDGAMTDRTVSFIAGQPSLAFQILAVLIAILQQILGG